MKDNYGTEVDTNWFCVLPDISRLDENEIKVVVNANWYDVIFKNEQVLLCADQREIDGLGEDGIVGCITSKGGISEIMAVNEVLKRWSDEDGFYHA